VFKLIIKLNLVILLATGLAVNASVRYWELDPISLNETRKLNTDTYNCAVQSSRPGTKADGKGRLCSASVLSQTQLIFPKNCLNRLSRARTGRSLKLVCLSGAIEIPIKNNSKALNKDFTFVKLPTALPILPPIILKSKDKLKDLKNCEVHTPKRVIKVKKLSYISHYSFNSSEIGSSIRCVDEKNNIHIVGLITGEKEFNYLWDLNNLHTKIDSTIILPTPRDEMSYVESCKESVNCIEDLEKEIPKLTSDIIKIINRMNKDLKEIQGKISHRVNEIQLEALKDEFDDLRHLCFETTNKANTLEDDEVDTNWRDSLMGFIEGGAIATVDGFTAAVNFTPIDWDYNFLLNQFRDVEILKENLSDDDFKRIYARTDRKYPKASNLDKIKNLTASYAQEVVKKIADEMNLNREKDHDFESELMLQFKKCLKSAVDKETVLECADKFSTTAAVKISKIELENQLRENFKDRFTSDEYERVNKRAKQIYERCISKYFYNTSVHKDISSSDKAKACVFESILSAYELTKQKELKLVLKGLYDKKTEAKVIREIEQEAQKCHLGSIINSPERLSNRDYKTLSLLKIDDYKDSLFSCVESLSIKAGEHVVKGSIASNPQVIDNIKDPAQISRLASNAISNEYKECIEIQEKQGQVDPQRCRDLITSVTTVDVAKEVINNTVDEMFEGKQYPSTLKKNIENTMSICRSDISNKAINSLKNEEDIDLGRDLNKCIIDSIDHIVSDLTTIKIEESLKEKESLSKYKSEILSNRKIKDLTRITRECFRTELSKFDSVEDLTSNLDSIQDQCIFKTEQRATQTIALILMEKELTPVLEDESLVSEVIKTYYERDNGLKLRISNTTNKDELDRTVALITPQLTRIAATKVIPNLVDEYLSEYDDIILERTKNILNKDINQCLDKVLTMDNNKIEVEVNKCMNKVSSLGYSSIGEIIISKNIDDTLGDFPGRAFKLKNESKNRITECLTKISKTADNSEYKTKSENCLSKEVYTLSHSIPREAWLAYSKHTTTKLSPSTLEAKLLEVERYFIITGKYPKSKNDPIVKAHSDLMECLQAKKDNLLASDSLDIANVLKHYPKCTDGVEANIKSEIAAKFGVDNAPAKEFITDFIDLGLILTGLTGESSKETASNNSSPGLQLAQQVKRPHITEQDPSVIDAFRLMSTIGQKAATACIFNASSCRDSIKKTKRDLENYKQNNPNATADQLKDKFIDSKFMDEVIKSELAATLRVELIQGLDDYKDSGGIMSKVIRDITSPKAVNQIIATPYGKEILDSIKHEIKKDNLDDVGSNKKLRAALAKAITHNTGNDSIIDKLMYGLVQPTLNDERKSSNGLFGVFKNFKVALGRVFRVVRARDFKWEKIRNTEKGRKAREIFAKQIFAPIIRGEDLEKRPAQNSKNKSFLEEKSSQIENLIIDGLKSL